MRVIDIIKHIEDVAPLGLQEDFDNAGLIVGDPDQDVNSCLCCVDVTQEVIDEALKIGAGLIVSHHPLLFSGLKNLVPDGGGLKNILLQCIRKNLAVYAAHTNLDKISGGISGRLANEVGLLNQEILVPERQALLKLVVFVPEKNHQEVAKALFQSGAGEIGQYDSCSFRSIGTGTFRGGETSQPFVGEAGTFHEENEVRLEVILPAYAKHQVVKALIKVHPYEEVAYDLYAVMNDNPYAGLGIVGDLSEEMSETDFLKLLQQQLVCKMIRHTGLLNQKVKRVAVCGGSGSAFVRDAIRAGAQFYVSADFKYHQFFEAANKLVIADVGHYESEQFAKDILRDILTKKMPNFAVHLSKVNTNPIKYF